MGWYEWNQTDLPCQFSADRAQENRAYLERLLEIDFARPGREKSGNPLLRVWNTTGAVAFLEMNWLTEDLRLVEGKPGLKPVLRDLCDERLCLPTWHALHTAALFECARPHTVLEFVVADGDEAPDFVVDIAGDRIPVEAKLLMRSEDEGRFVSVAERMMRVLVDDRQGTPIQTVVYVIFKQPISHDVSQEAIRFCDEAIGRYGRTAVCERGTLCNVFLEPAEMLPGLADYRVVYIMAPVPGSEDLRVLGRAKKASSQLRALPSTLDSGILSVGLTDNQDGAAVFGHLSERIKRGRFGGISGVLLLKRRTHVAPPRRATFDLLEFRRNSNADRLLRDRVRLLPLGAAALLTQSEPHLSGIRAYRSGTATGRVTDPATARVILPNVRVLTADLLE